MSAPSSAFDMIGEPPTLIVGPTQQSVTQITDIGYTTRLPVTKLDHRSTPIALYTGQIIVVGVKTYDTSTFAKLTHAAEDTTALASQLTTLGFRTTVMV